MTALEEIKKALEGQILEKWATHQWLRGTAIVVANDDGSAKRYSDDSMVFEIPTSMPENAHYIAAVNPAAISELLSTIESLQAKNEGLLKRAATAEKRLRGANAAFERERKLHLKNQELNRKLEARAEAVEAEVKRLRRGIQWCLDRDERNGSLPGSYADKLQALTSTGGERHADK